MGSLRGARDMHAGKPERSMYGARGGINSAWAVP